MIPPADPAYLANEATDRIALFLSQEQQLNALGAVCEILLDQTGAILAHLNLPVGHGLDQTQIDRLARIQTIWDWIKATRAKEAEIRTRIVAGETIDKADIDWPVPPVL